MLLHDWQILFSWARKSRWMVTAAMKLRRLLLERKAITNPDKCIKKQRHHFANKGLYSQSYGFSSSHAQMWQLNHKERWGPKNWCFWTVVLEKTLESPLDCKEFKPVNPKGNQPWIFIGRTDAKAEATILWLPDAKSWLTGKDPDAGKDWGQEEKGITEDEIVGWLCCRNRYSRNQAPHSESGRTQVYYTGGPWGVNTLSSWP